MAFVCSIGEFTSATIKFCVRLCRRIISSKVAKGSGRLRYFYKHSYLCQVTHAAMHMLDVVELDARRLASGKARHKRKQGRLATC